MATWDPVDARHLAAERKTERREIVGDDPMLADALSPSGDATPQVAPSLGTPAVPRPGPGPAEAPVPGPMPGPGLSPAARSYALDMTAAKKGLAGLSPRASRLPPPILAACASDAFPRLGGTIANTIARLGCCTSAPQAVMHLRMALEALAEAAGVPAASSHVAGAVTGGRVPRPKRVPFPARKLVTKALQGDPGARQTVAGILAADAQAPGPAVSPAAFALRKAHGTIRREAFEDHYLALGKAYAKTGRHVAGVSFTYDLGDLS